MILPMSLISLLAIAVGAALGLVLVSGRISEAWRTRIKVAMVILLYPAFILNWIDGAFEQAVEGNWWRVGIKTVAAMAIAIVGVQALRERRLWPQAFST